MFDLATIRLRTNPGDPGACEFLDPATGHLLAVSDRDGASPPEPERPPGRFLALLSRQSGCLFLVLLVPYLLGGLLGFWPLIGGRARPSRRSIRRHPEGDVLFSIRDASGMMYQSRRVYDAEGKLLAHFRSPFKSGLRGGFALIDLRRLDDDGRDIGDRPWLGRVATDGPAYRLDLAGRPSAARIVPSIPPGASDVEIAPILRGDATAQVLLLASALTLTR